MNITVHQSISIYMIKVGAITNSSILQIGSTGSFQAQSTVQNTGGFTEPAEEAEPGAGDFAQQASPIIPLNR
ncbi:spore germination protein GerPB [Oceanobacillus kapialis]|uniref:Spore germination protein GerPB n=1 Tax=Oceanobacillus kapialis TaxID=481353 RepID=A0ABW5Q3V0_9BACI